MGDIINRRLLIKTLTELLIILLKIIFTERFREIQFQPIDKLVPFYVNPKTGEITIYLRDENEHLDFDSDPKVYFFTVVARDNPGFSPSSMIFFFILYRNIFST